MSFGCDKICSKTEVTLCVSVSIDYSFGGGELSDLQLLQNVQGRITIIKTNHGAAFWCSGGKGRKGFNKTNHLE